uniref:Uncharacterized protein n=1 Tax=Anguilla anguilla TaxID=7936 RepID=A0A0E9TDY0_ANGAN
MFSQYYRGMFFSNVITLPLHGTECFVLAYSHVGLSASLCPVVPSVRKPARSLAFRAWHTHVAAFSLPGRW